jgi:UDP-N-acetylglucosamine 2-epimerase (non-hydrolysing)
MTSTSRPVVLCVVGARPNFVKIAPVMTAIAQDGRLTAKLVHTGQHYDPDMNDQFFIDLGIPRPDVNLAVGSSSHAVQTGEVMIRFEPALDQIRPNLVLVVGDVNSTLATSLVAVKKGIAVAHVEAGLRSFDRTMPEEINRILTDQISDYLFVTEREAVANLQREGVATDKVHFVGNVMIDALRQCLPRAASPETTLAASGIKVPPSYAVATLHRPSNVDDPGILTRLLEVFERIGRDLPIIFPIHPRTRARIEAAGLADKLRSASILAVAPVSYLGMLGLLGRAALVLTDSGGLQEETTALGVPCFTLRANTERPITVAQGTSTIVGNDPQRILAAFHDLQQTGGKKGRQPELWDGRAAERIAAILGDALTASS